ncbi:MAG: hypothetical protein JKY32_07180 [Rhizobiales bacterium]|nr:hypothetical protein [Hyphomicrobiales bacterium]
MTPDSAIRDALNEWRAAVKELTCCEADEEDMSAIIRDVAGEFEVEVDRVRSVYITYILGASLF